jgi:hypothetical protein
MPEEKLDELGWGGGGRCFRLHNGRKQGTFGRSKLITCSDTSVYYLCVHFQSGICQAIETKINSKKTSFVLSETRLMLHIIIGFLSSVVGISNKIKTNQLINSYKQIIVLIKTSNNPVIYY